MTASNSFGRVFKITSFGESHGPAIGVVIDGAPANLAWDDQLVAHELDRRRPGKSSVTSSRLEPDKHEILSGIFDGKTLGTPIALVVRNLDARSEDYKNLPPRVGHADDVWLAKFGHSDSRGGGRSSGRETLARVMGGAVGKMILRAAMPRFSIQSFSRQIGPFSLNSSELNLISEHRLNSENFVAGFPSKDRQEQVEKILLDAKLQGRSFGGVAEIWIDGVSAGLGQPVFQKLKSDLAAAMMGVGATTSFELGDGLDAVSAEGSEFHSRTDSSRYGGIRGGISTGERIVLRVGFKPTSSVLDIAKKGRHDPCIVPRALPVLEAMACLVLADHYLLARCDQI